MRRFGYMLAAIVLTASLAGASASGAEASRFGITLPIVTRFVEWAEASSAVAAASSANVNVSFTITKPSAGVRTAIFRFYSAKSGTHFYTPSAEERDIVIARWPDVWSYEGIAYYVNPAKNVQPLYRFYNRANGSHFYTASPNERDMVFAKWMNVFTYDGPTYAVTPYAEAGKAPVWRFFNKKNGSHFYTASAEEADNVIAKWPTIYQLEGIAFWLGQ